MGEIISQNLILGYEETYQERLNEIQEMLKFMFLMDLIDQGIGSDISYHTMMIKAKEKYISIANKDVIDQIPSYSLVSSVTRSNTKLMIYNMIEFTITSLLQAIYDRIGDEKCGYSKVSDEIKKIWHHSRLSKTMKDPTSNNETIEQLSKKLVDEAISEATLKFDSRNILSGGNLDGETILKIFNNHGVVLHPEKSKFRQDELKEIKNQRNELAHGSISFADAGNQITVQEIETVVDNVNSFLTQLREDVIYYLNNKEYMTMKDSIS